ncbi:hypothetical protein ACF0H5_003392 [Mactra antiquata]
MNPVKEYENQVPVPKIKLWDKTKTNDFVNNIDHDVIETIYNSLRSLEQNGNFNQETANATVSMISELFLNGSKQAFGTYHNNNINENSGMNTKENKLPTWFGSQCTKARRNFHRARYLYKIRKTDINKEHLKQTSKIYKRTLNKYNNKSKSKTIKQIRNLKHSDPSKFWKILRGNNSKQCDANLDDLYTFFRDVNDTFIKTETDAMPIHTDSSNEHINSRITEKEIESAVKSLNNNKACGYDNIVNEHIKSTYCLMKHVCISKIVQFSI